MNYRIRVDNADIVVSQEENDLIKRSMKGGASIVYLRGESLAVNVNFIRYIKKTDRLTEVQEEESKARMRLPPRGESSARSGTGMSAVSHNEFFDRMGWEHKKDCTCRKPGGSRDGK